MELLKICLIVGVFLVTTSFASVEDYPPKGYFDSDDVTQVTWAHSVNSKSKLEAGLKSKSIRMLEADVLIGLVRGSTAKVPIMAHPPMLVSDLSLTVFLDEVIAHNSGLNLTERKGIKLDFKVHAAAELGLEILLQKYLENADHPPEFPVWINADILPGPVNASSDLKVNGTDLISRVNSIAQEQPDILTLSLGWTTRFFYGGRYSKDQLNDMANFLIESNSTTPISFPMRAHSALNAVEDIKEFMNQSEIAEMSPSVTLWEGVLDPRVDQQELEEFVEVIGKDRVFVDLPYSFPVGDDGGDDGGGGGGSEEEGDDTTTTTEKDQTGTGMRHVTNMSIVLGFLIFIFIYSY